MRWMLVALAVLPLTACGQQVRYGTAETRSSIPQILEDQAVSNAAGSARNPLFIPAQMILKESLTSSTNSVNLGILPGIAFRAIAVTGLNLSGDTSLQQNWSSNPVSGYLDLKRLQVFYSYAVHSSPQTFDEFEKTLEALGKPSENAASTPPDKKEARNIPSRPYIDLSKQIGRLPKSGFIKVNDPGGCPGGVEKIVYYSLDRVCVQANSIDGQPIAADALLSLFVMWSIAIPDLTAPTEDQPSPRGASPRGSSFSITPPPALRLR